MDPAAPAAAPAAEPAEPEEKKDLFTFIADSVKDAVDAPASADAELVFVGPKNSGKSTLVHAFLQKDEPPKPSTPLEYRYARHTVGTRAAVVANVWELGGGVSSTAHLSELVKTVLLPELLPRAVVAIVLDLSEPHSVLTTLITWLDEVRKRVQEMQRELALSAEGAAVAAKARKATEAVWAEHPDYAVTADEPVTPGGVPVVIFAHKYDVFQEAYPDSEMQKVMCRTLRFFAHQAGASLLCTKHKDNASKYLLRNMLSHHVFGNVRIDAAQLQTSHMKPLFVPATADAMAGIGKAPSVAGCISDAMADKWKAVFEEVFPPRAGKKEAQADLTMVEAEQFAEEAIDELRRQKRAELMKMRKAAEFEAKMRDAGSAAATDAPGEGM